MEDAAVGDAVENTFFAVAHEFVDVGGGDFRVGPAGDDFTVRVHFFKPDTADGYMGSFDSQPSRFFGLYDGALDATSHVCFMHDIATAQASALSETGTNYLWLGIRTTISW